MRRVLARLVPSPALGVALVALLLACGGFAYASTVGESLVRACANRKTGALRIARKCKRNERRVTWNAVGPQGVKGSRGTAGLRGLTGAQGPAGAPGATGLQGPQGPGATSFATTVEAGGSTTLAVLNNGVTITGACGGGADATFVVSGNTLQMSVEMVELIPTEKRGQFDFNNTSSHGFEAQILDISGVVRSSAGGKFAQVTLHGEKGASSCTFWGIAIPSS